MAICSERLANEAHILAAPVARGPEPHDQPGRFQHVEVVGEQVGGQTEALGELLRRAVADSKVVDDRQADRLTQCGVYRRSPLEVWDPFGRIWSLVRCGGHTLAQSLDHLAERGGEVLNTDSGARREPTVQRQDRYPSTSEVSSPHTAFLGTPGRHHHSPW